MTGADAHAQAPANDAEPTDEETTDASREPAPSASAADESEDEGWDDPDEAPRPRPERVYTEEDEDFDEPVFEEPAPAYTAPPAPVSAHPAFDDTLYAALDPETAIERRALFGGPARARVDEQITAWRGRLAARGVEA